MGCIVEQFRNICFLSLHLFPVSSLISLSRKTSFCCCVAKLSEHYIIGSSKSKMAFFEKQHVMNLPASLQGSSVYSTWRKKHNLTQKWMKSTACQLKQSYSVCKLHCGLKEITNIHGFIFFISCDQTLVWRHCEGLKGKTYV